MSLVGVGMDSNLIRSHFLLTYPDADLNLWHPIFYFQIWYGSFYSSQIGLLAWLFRLDTEPRCVHWCLLILWYDMYSSFQYHDKKLFSLIGTINRLAAACITGVTLSFFFCGANVSLVIYFSCFTLVELNCIVLYWHCINALSFVCGTWWITLLCKSSWV